MRLPTAPSLLVTVVLALLGGAAGIYAIAVAVPAGFHGMLYSALLTTALVTAGGVLLGLVVALLLFAGLTSPGRAWLRQAAALSIAAGRAVPLVCVLLLAYWVPPLLGLDIPPLWCAVAAIGYVEGCYLAAILAGLRETVASRHREAAYMLGLRPKDWRRRILLPQIARLAMPHLTNFAVYTLKASALAWFISVQDLTQVVRVISTATADPLVAYALLFASYLFAGAVLTGAGQLIEARLARRMPAGAAGFRDA